MTDDKNLIENLVTLRAVLDRCTGIVSELLIAAELRADPTGMTATSVSWAGAENGMPTDVVGSTRVPRPGFPSSLDDHDMEGCQDPGCEETHYA